MSTKSEQSGPSYPPLHEHTPVRESQMPLTAPEQSFGHGVFLSAGGIVVGVAEGAPDGASVGSLVKGATVRVDPSINRLVRLVTSPSTTVLLDICSGMLTLSAET